LRTVVPVVKFGTDGLLKNPLCHMQQGIAQISIMELVAEIENTQGNVWIN